MTWRLLPGLRLVRRDADHLQLGTDPPLLAVLPDRDGVRVLVRDLACGAPLPTLDEHTAPVLSDLVGAGLVVAADALAARAQQLRALRVHVDAPDSVLPSALGLLRDAGLSVAAEDHDATAALVWGEGEPSRDRLDEWVRSGVPHLVVTELADGPRVGPYVVPGVSACLRCVDAHADERDPRRSLVIEQQATSRALSPFRPDPPARALALAWAVTDLVTAATGGTPSSWSATVGLGTLPPEVTAYRRHPHCGCTWAEELAG